LQFAKRFFIFFSLPLAANPIICAMCELYSQSRQNNTKRKLFSRDKPLLTALKIRGIILAPTPLPKP